MSYALLQTRQHICAQSHHLAGLLLCFCSPLLSNPLFNLFDSLSIPFDGWLLLMCSYSMDVCLESNPSLHRFGCADGVIAPPPPTDYCCAPPVAAIHRWVDCCVCRVQQQLHCTSGTSLVHKSAEVHRLVHSHQTISVVLMAKSAAARRSPAAADVDDDGGRV